MADGRKPDFDVFAIRERDGGKDVFTKIGVAFKRQEGQGVSILLDALPLGRRLAVLPPLPPQEAEK
jgi:hypothetical protein